MRPEHVVRFDGSFETALSAFRNAGEEPVLLIVDAADRGALTTIGHARAAGVVTEALVLVSALGPLGRSVLAELAAGLAPRTDAGTVLAALREFERRTRSFVVVDSPGRLHRPAPSLWQHMWGLLPGTCFVGELGGRVTAVGRRGLPQAMRDGLADPASSVHCTDTGDVSSHRRNAVEQIVASAAPRRHVMHPAGGEAAAAWWGPARSVEVCVCPTDVEQIIAAVHSGSVVCSWCGLTAVGGSCAVCGSAVGRPSAADPVRIEPTGTAARSSSSTHHITPEGLPA